MSNVTIGNLPEPRTLGDAQFKHAQCTPSQTLPRLAEINTERGTYHKQRLPSLSSTFILPVFLYARQPQQLIQWY